MFSRYQERDYLSFFVLIPTLWSLTFFLIIITHSLTDKTSIDMKWILTSFGAFILSLVSAALLIFWGRKLIGPDRAIFYLIILVPLASASAIILFKSLRSYATLTKKIPNYKLELAGPVVVFILVIAIGYKFYQNPPFLNFNLVIQFEGSSGDQPSGHATVSSGNRFEDITVSNGKGTFAEATPGSDIKIVPAFQGYKRETIKREVPSEKEPLTITLLRDTAYFSQLNKWKVEYLSIVSTYLSNAKDFSEVLNHVINRVLRYDSTAIIEMSKYASLYADAYRRLDIVSDSLGYLISQYSPELAQKLRDLSRRSLDFHNQYYIKLYNDNIMVKTNNYLLAGKINNATENSIINDVSSFFSFTAGSIQTIQDEMNHFKESLNKPGI